MNYILQHAHSNLPAGQINKQPFERTLLNAAYKEAVILTTLNSNLRTCCYSGKRYRSLSTHQFHLVASRLSERPSQTPLHQ